MSSKLSLLCSSLLRGLQILFAIVVLGLSATLVRTHNSAADAESKIYGDVAFSKASPILSFAAAVGALSLLAAVFNLFLSWTEFLREYVEMLVDAVVIVANVVGGMVLAVKLKGSKCGDTSDENRDLLSQIDILNGGCAQGLGEWICVNYNHPERVNKRCQQSRTDYVFMFLTAVVLCATLALALLRSRK